MIVPQYLGRLDFVVALDEAAQRCDARFVEVLVEGDRAVSTDRFRSRRGELLARGEPHPQADVDDVDVEWAVADAIERLELVRSQRPRAVAIIADAGVEETYAALLAAIDVAAR